MSPVRVQRRREKGWRMPENTVYVGRPTRWGNPFGISERGRRDPIAAPITRMLVTTAFRLWLVREIKIFLTIDLTPLRGKNLACWCPLDQPCHADVLLELANA